MRIRFFAKRISAFLAATLCLFACVMSGASLTVNAAYENTHVNTGDQPFDLIAVAKTQLGYVEGSSNYNKYSTELVGSAYQPWCGYFISWCARQAGISTSIIPTTGSSTAFFNIGTYHSRTSGYAPQPGDIMMYGVYGDAYHVSIVESFDASTSTVYVLDGNWSDKVSSHSTTLSNGEVAGFVTPNYTSGVTEMTAFNMVTPSVIAVGSSYSISGYISSPNMITSVTVSVTDENGNAVISQSAAPNANTYELKALDAYIKFGSLDVGMYSYTVTATDSAGTKRWSYMFEVVSSVEITIADVVAPDVIELGKSFKISGVISCIEPITHVSVSVYNRDGVYKTGGTATPNTKTYDIKGVDNYVSFGRLSEGKHTMTIVARSAHGSQTWNYVFYVGSKPTYTLTGAVYPTDYIEGGRVTIGGTVTASETLTDVTAMILDESGLSKSKTNTAPNTTSFNLVEFDGDLAFSTLPAGKYTYVVTATSLNGDQTWSYPFVVGEKIEFTLTDAKYPETVEKGNTFSIGGTVTATENLKKVTITILDESGTELSKATAAPDALTYDLKTLDKDIKFGTLEKGNYTYVIAAVTENGSHTWTYPFVVRKTVTFTLTDVKYPTTHEKGTSFPIGGTLTSSELLSEVTVKVLDESGAEVIKATAAPNTYVYDIYSLDSSVRFGTLEKGNYTYVIAAVTENGQKSWEYPFIVQKTVTFTLNNAVYPTQIDEGASFSISGTVTASETLTKVSITVTDIYGNVKLSASGTPNATVFSLGTLDTQLPFGTLTAGRYTYTIHAQTAGGEKTWEYSFKVGDVEDIRYGDVNIDGEVDIFDAMDLYMHVSGDKTLTDEQLEYVAAEEADIFAAMDLYQFVTGNIEAYP